MRVIFFLFSLLMFSLGCSGSMGGPGESCADSNNPNCQTELALVCTATQSACGPNCCDDATQVCGAGNTCQWKLPPWTCLPDDCPEPPVRPPNPLDLSSDVDCDGIPDWQEAQFGTDPKNRDTDGDGIWDGIEMGLTASPDPLCQDYFPKNLSATGRTITSPTRQDSDCDGIADGDEDKNKNGRLDDNKLLPDALKETNPTHVDSDDDGLWDGVEVGVRRGFILLHGERVPFGGTVQSPEGKWIQAKVDPLCNNRRQQYAAEEADCPPASRRITFPWNPDSDGDGLLDGTEDSNKNGCFEPNLFEDENANPKRGRFYEGPGHVGETDPLKPDLNVVSKICLPENWAKVDIRRNSAAQLALGLPLGFQYVDILNGTTTRGVMGVDAAKNVAFVAWKHPRPVADLAALQALATQQARDVGSTVNPTIPAAFATWDSALPNAYSSTFTLSANMSVAARVNAIASKLLNTTDVLPLVGSSGPTQYVRAQYIRRSNGEVVVVMAVALDNDHIKGGPGFFGLMDVAGGAIASHLDRTVVQCERALVLRKKVDFLFVVDDSGSMSGSQSQLKIAASAMAEALENSTLEWRAALVTSSYHTNGFGNSGIIRGFTNNVRLLQDWLQAGGNNRYCNETTRVAICRDWIRTGVCSNYGTNNGCWIDVHGNGQEGMLGAARLAMMDMHDKNAPAAVKFQEDAEIVVIILSDTDDKTTSLFTTYEPPSGTVAGNWEPVQYFVDFFKGLPSMVKLFPDFQDCSKMPAHQCMDAPVVPASLVYTIACPAGKNCGDSTPPLPAPTRTQRVADETGGFFTDISNPKAISDSMAEIVRSIISRAGVKTQKPFIGASLRVAVEHPEDPAICNGANLKRDRQNGFDYDGIAQTVSFFGACKPKTGTESLVTIAYRAWEASNRLPCEEDIRFINDESQGYCRGLFECNRDNDKCTCPNACDGKCTADKPICDMQTCECVAGATPLQ